MLPRPTPTTARLLLVSAVVLAAPATARAADPPTIEGLSPRLTAVAQAASGSTATQARRAGLPRSGPASLSRIGSRVVVQVTPDGSPAAAARALAAAGAGVLHRSAGSGVITAAVAPSALRRVGAADGVRVAREVLRPLLHGTAGSGGPPARAEATCGSATSQADAALRTVDARERFGVDGTGVTVGVLSDTYDLDTGDATSAAEDVASGDLPGPGNPCGRTTPVDVVDDRAVERDTEYEPTDEGRAMTQLVHDLAPGARLAFATAFGGQELFAANILRLQQAGAQVITDDVGYFDEPFFQPGPIDTAISTVRDRGVSYYSSAGNSHLEDQQGRAIGSWESAALRPVSTDGAAAGVLPQGLPGAAEHTTAYADFDPRPGTVDTGFGITVPAGTEILVDLQWAQPVDGVHTDLDAYLHDGAGTVLTTSNALNAGPEGDGVPVEIVAWKNTGSSPRTVQLSVGRFGDGTAGDDGTPRLKFLLVKLAGAGPTATEYPAGTTTDTVGPTVFGHSGGAGTVSVGAVDARTTSAPESFSSRGPVTALFGPVATGDGPADALPAPVTRTKPDLAATDCVSTTFFGSGRIFCGTSAAAPHAAAVDALARQAAPRATDDQIVGLVQQSGRPVGAFGADAVGSGLIDAVSAVSAASDLEATFPPLPTPSTPTDPAPTPADPIPTPPGPSAPNPAPAAPAPAPAPVVPRPAAADRPAPRVRVTSAPRSRTTKRRAVFRLSTERGARLTCRLDRGKAKRCASRYAVTVSRGAHVLRVYATDAAGNRSATAVRRWRVVRG